MSYELFELFVTEIVYINMETNTINTCMIAIISQESELLGM